MKPKFQGGIVHTNNTIQILYKTIYSLFEQKKIWIRMLVGLLMAAAAILVDMPTLLQVALLMVGAWLLVSRDYPASAWADKAIAVRAGDLPAIQYKFLDKNLEVENGKKTYIKYNQIQMLIEDKQYLYICESKQSVCMIDKASIQPAKIQEFMDYIEEKTAKSWRKNKLFRHLNLYDLLRMMRKE